MCGISGLIGGGSRPDYAERVARISELMSHRGPDDTGLEIVPPAPQSPWTAALGHRRLAIIDPSPAGHQPMRASGGAAWITFNGEIYNYRELRAELEATGRHRFHTGSDTEVLLAGWAEWGERLPARLNGMFALGIWDPVRQSAFLSRDRFGEKPLFYRLGDGEIAFASEVQALARDPGFTRRADLDAINTYLAFGYIPGERSAFQGIRKLPAGHSLLWSGGEARPSAYWRVPSGPARRITEADALPIFPERFERAVARRMVADVPVGVFLSGGLDSSAVATAMAKLAPGRLLSFSIGFRERAWDESGAAREFAARLGAKHHEEIVTPDAQEILPLLVEHYGEPFADASAIPTCYLARMTARHVKVALSGDGGDELFAGYRRHLAARLAARLPRLPRALSSGLASSLARGRLADQKSRAAGALRFLGGLDKPPALRSLAWMRLFRPEDRLDLEGPELRAAREAGADPEAGLTAMLLAEDGAAPLDRILRADLAFYLVDDLMVKTDIAGMCYGLESRAPMLDHELVEWAVGIPSDLKAGGLTTKRLLRRALSGTLPGAVLERPKMGFGVPMSAWLRGPLRPLVREHLEEGKSPLLGPVLRREAVARLVREHEDGGHDHGYRLWALLLLVLWHQRFLE